MEEYIDVKNQAIEDSKTMNFDGAESKEKAALLKLQEKNIEGTKAQMVYVANLLIPDDEEFLNNYSNDKSIDSLMKIYEAPKYVISTKIEELKDRINEIEASKQEETQEPEIEGESNMEEFNLENTDVTEEVVPEETGAISLEPFELTSGDEKTELPDNAGVALTQDTVDALGVLGLVGQKDESNTRKIADLEAAIEEFKEKLAELEEENSRLTTENNNLKDDVDRKESEIGTLNDKIKSQAETISDNETTINKLNEEAERKDSKIAEQAETIENFKVQTKEQAETIDYLTKENKANEDEISNNIIKFNTLSDKYSIAVEDSKRKDAIILEFKAANEQLTKERDTANGNLNKLVGEIKKLTSPREAVLPQEESHKEKAS